MRIDALDDFAVQLHHQTQNAVRGGMLRAEVDRVILNLDIADLGIFPVKAMFDLVEIVGHWFCPFPLEGTTSGLAGFSPASGPALPAPDCAVLSVVLG